jgi:uncharacterized membrane protein
MNALSVIIGGLLGVLLGSAGRNPALGLFCGLALGVLYARTVALQRRLDDVETRLGRAKTPRQAPGPAPGPRPSAPPTGAESASEPAVRAVAKEGFTPSAGPPLPDEPWPETPAASATPVPRRPAPGERLFAYAKNWLTTGNVPVKVGVLISFFGVSFLLKYAIDRELFKLPIEFRLLGVAAAGLAMIVVGWRLRERRQGYGLSLQGGGAGILFLTVYAALRIWQLLPETTAFVLLAVIAAATGALAVFQNARTLALFGVAGGFLAPVLASTGEGSHVALFSYYLVINAAILGIAWFRAWRELNLVGFVFTFLVSCFWGYRYYRPELFATTEPFLVLYFLFYQAIAILYALRRAPERPDAVDGTLVFGTPVIAFGLQSALLYGSEYGLAISAAVLAVFYAACSLGLQRNKSRHPRLLTEAYRALAVAFGTLAIPLAFDARWTSAAWALEGAALIWVGVRQGRHLANLAGVVLVFLAGGAFTVYGWSDGVGYPVLNGNVLGGAMIACAAFFAARRLEGFGRDSALSLLYRVATAALFAWGVLWWLGAGWAEILDRVRSPWPLATMLAFTAASAALAIGLGRWRTWTGMRAASMILLPLLALFAAFAWLDDGHFLPDGGWIAWPLALLAQALALRDADQRPSPLAAAWHLASLFGTVALVSGELLWQVDRVASSDWAVTAAIAVAGLAALLILATRTRPAWPVASNRTVYLPAAALLVGLQLAGTALTSVAAPGDPSPLDYIVLLNPFGLGMLFAGLTAFVTWRFVLPDPAVPDDLRRIAPFVLAPAFFVITTAALVRAVHHLAGVAWTSEALFESVRVQATLSIYWGLLGFVCMIGGARTARRTLWIAGAGCMAVVVVKLFLVDLGNSGTVERIVSFIGTGVLLLVVGYFAPVPPREPGGGEAVQDRERGTG